MPGFYSELSEDPDYLSIPQRIDEEALEKRVIQLRLGDMSQVNPISVLLMRHVMCLVAKFAHPRRTSDLVGVGLLTLVESVRRASTRLKDNNIIPYVTTNVIKRLKDAINDDHVVRVPGRTLRLARSKGQTLQTFDTRFSSEDVPSNVSSKRDGQFYRPAIARAEHPSPECLDILRKIVRDDRERLYIEMRSEGHVLETIAGKMGVSIGTVHSIKESLKERYQEYDKD